MERYIPKWSGIHSSLGSEMSGIYFLHNFLRCFFFMSTRTYFSKHFCYQVAYFCNQVKYLLLGIYNFIVLKTKHPNYVKTL